MASIAASNKTHILCCALKFSMEAFTYQKKTEHNQEFKERIFSVYSKALQRRIFFVRAHRGIAGKLTQFQFIPQHFVQWYCLFSPSPTHFERNKRKPIHFLWLTNGLCPPHNACQSSSPNNTHTWQPNDVQHPKTVLFHFFISPFQLLSISRRVIVWKNHINF